MTVRQSAKVVAACWATVLALACVLSVAPQAVRAGDTLDAAREAERQMANGDHANAVASMDRAVEALWAELPLHLRVATFVEPGSVTGYSRYRFTGAEFRVGDPAAVYLEPIGYGFLPAGANVAVDIRTAVEIRSPGGIIFASAPDFSRFGWNGRRGTRELHGTISMAVPKLKPGDYELLIDLTDSATGKSAAVTLPFAIIE